MSKYVMTAEKLAETAGTIATKYKTLYVMGGFGAPLNARNKARYTGSGANEYNLRAANKAKIMDATNDTFAFDCVGLIKGILWGWDGNLNDVYGGATYNENGVPDYGANTVISVCKEVSTDFSHIDVGEAVWKEDHIGIYIGGGFAVECTPAWRDKVQITACNCDRAGYNRRNWTKHGKLPWVDYAKAEEVPADLPTQFVDVPKDKFYTKAVQWAVENGITKGTDEKHFDPEDYCTRGQMVTFLYRLWKLLRK